MCKTDTGLTMDLQGNTEAIPLLGVELSTTLTITGSQCLLMKKN